MNKLKEQIQTIDGQIRQVKQNIENYKEHILIVLGAREISDNDKEKFKNTCLEHIELDKRFLELLNGIRESLLTQLPQTEQLIK